MYGFVHDSETAIRKSSERWSISPDELAPPPHSGSMFLLWRAEPILPEHSADHPWRRVGEGIAGEESEYGTIILKEKLFSSRHHRILLPRSQRSEP
jgi:hypothetical protein